MKFVRGTLTRRSGASVLLPHPVNRARARWFACTPVLVNDFNLAAVQKAAGTRQGGKDGLTIVDL